MGQIQTLGEFLGLLVRRRLLIAAVAALGSVLAVMYALSRPAIYQAAAVIQVESPTVTDPAAPTGSAQRLQAIQQRLTTRDNFLAMIDRHGLYAGLPLTDDEKVHLLRQAVQFQPVASAGPASFGAPQGVSAVIILAQAETGDLAARIANDVAQQMLDAGAQTQTGRAREALTFFAAEERRVSAALAALEAEVTAYQTSHADALPGLRDLRRDEFLGIEGDLRALDGQLAALTAEQAALTGAGRTLRETDRRQIEARAGQASVLQARRETLAQRREQLVSAMARMPEVERTLAAYERRLDQLRAQADQVTRRLSEADTAAKLEEGQQAERFTLLERAVTPDYPVTGGRKRLAMVGVAASVVLGVVAAFLLDLLTPYVRTAGQMERQIGLRPVVSIPVIGHIRPMRDGGLPVRMEVVERGLSEGLGLRLWPGGLRLAAGVAVAVGVVLALAAVA
jgi:uncharacterized protein involved in exopolysaccharide biosynthesis